MATQFKSFSRPSLSNNSGSPTTIIANSIITGSNVGVIIGCIVTNKTGATQTVTVTLVKTGGSPSTHLIYNLDLAPGVGFEIFTGSKLVMEVGDSITAYASNSNAVDLTISLMING